MWNKKGGSKKVPKKGTWRWYKHHAVEKAKKIAKHRDGYCCQYCGKSDGQIHGSHVLSVGSYPGMSADLLNIKALCSYHHSWWHDNPLDAHEWFKKKFPDRYEYLMIEKNIAVKRDWEAIKSERDQQLKDINI